MRHLQHHFFSNSLNTSREIHLALRYRRLRRARRSVKEFVKSAVRHAQTLRVAEVFLVEFQAAVVAHFKQVILDLIDVSRLSVRRQAHDLVLAIVDFESGVVSESAVEQSQTVWITK